MLFKSEFHDRIRGGEIRCTVRIWQSPRVKVGGRYALGAGAVVVDKIYETSLDELTPALARRSGFASLVDLLKTAKHGAGERVFVIDFHYDGNTGARPRPETGAVSAEEADALAPLDLQRSVIEHCRPPERDADVLQSQQPHDALALGGASATAAECEPRDLAGEK
jgi:hypothetical protein